MKVKIKKLDERAIVPSYAKPGDAGLDLVAISIENINQEFGYIEYGTGIAVEIPEGHVGLLFPRSSISKTSLALTNSVGVIDSGYRGEIKFRFGASGIAASLALAKSIPFIDASGISSEVHYKVGDKIGQLIIIPYPNIEFEEVEELSTTERGDGGYGSTGN